MKLLYLAERKSGASKFWGVRKHYVSPAGGKSPMGIVSSDRLTREQAQAFARDWTKEQTDLPDK